MNKTVSDQKKEIEIIKKTQTEIKLKRKKVSTQTEAKRQASPKNIRDRRLNLRQ